MDVYPLGAIERDARSNGSVDDKTALALIDEIRRLTAETERLSGIIERKESIISHMKNHWVELPHGRDIPGWRSI